MCAGALFVWCKPPPLLVEAGAADVPVAGVKLLLLLEAGAADVPVSGVKPPAASNDCTSSNCVAICCSRALPQKSAQRQTKA